MAEIFKGTCFCGAVEIEVTGRPEAMGYCHCRSCRSWSASPVNAFTLWKPDAVKVTKGAGQLGTYALTDMSHRRFCRLCGGHVMASHPPLEMIDVYAATIPDLPFVAALHVNYQEKVLAIPDGLPKLKDFPEAFGGTGETMTE